MTDRTKAFLWLGAAFVGAFLVGAVLAPWAEVAAVVLVLGIAVTSTLFAAAYMFTRPWWSTPIGRALLISSTSLALLTDIALLYQWLGDDYALRDVVRLTVYTLIFLGASLKCVAFVAERRRR